MPKFCYTKLMFKTSKSTKIDPTSSTLLASVDNLTMGYIVTDMDHQVLSINHAARQLLSAVKHIVTLEKVVEQLPERLALLDHVMFCSAEHKSCSFREVELGDKKVRLFLAPIFVGDELRGNLLTLEDITERTASEHSRDQFLSFIVHELRTPLTAIHGNAELIQSYYQKALKDKGLSEMVSDIGTGSVSVLAMVNQLLDMSRLEEGRIQYDLQQFDINTVVGETVHSLSVIAKERGLTLKLTEPAEANMQVVGDPGRTKQALTNLIGNGLKFTEKGGVTVSLMQNKHQEVEVRVSDTGPGIPSESRAHMFQKYFQASNNKYRKDSTKSTGLGLYITKLMLEGMGGHISLLDAEPGKGSTFMISLSLATPERLAQLTKQLYDAKQGVQHAPVSEHQSMALIR
jgi:signal transduction histidine kinase